MPLIICVVVGTRWSGKLLGEWADEDGDEAATAMRNKIGGGKEEGIKGAGERERGKKRALQCGRQRYVGMLC